MSSSILAGERRWVPGPARRSGMTVLGKVVVPKPLNLPSQRLENHGLDPNVEIVPKGSLSWGSRSSSSASNPWGSSALSPNADGSSGSPSHLSGRPSSGGSGRPSTAGSDRTQEATASAWGPNSRPSSASGASTGNQTSLTSLRPRSAETRPGSSPLSRFAEPSSDNAGAWVPTGTVDKLVVASSKNDGFSLSSGDFPTLGSEKDNAGKTNESQDHGSHGHPSSSSGRAAHAKEKAVTPKADLSSGNVNPWKRDGSQHVEDQPIADKWQGDPQQYMNPNIPPQQFDSWHGPPMNGPPGVWYRGPPPGGPPYPPVAPGGYPMEPFPYYRPQFPAPPMVNSQPVPHPGAAGPRGHHPSNVDLYRPHAPDAYIRPGMPIRPGFYPGPVAYESYYGPPMGYCNSSEKDIPFMGMVGGPPVHGIYPAQITPEAGNNHARGGVRGPAVKPSVSEQVDSGHTEETRGPFKVLMKQHNEWGGKEEEDNWEHLEKGDQPRRVLPRTEWGADDRRDEEMYSRTTPGENFSKQGTYTLDKAKAVDDRGGRKSEISAVSSPEVTRVRPTTPKDPTLIQKIEGLNAKARGTDGRQDTAFGSGREDQKNRLHGVNAKSNHSTNEVAQTTGDLIPAFHIEGVSTGGDKIIQSTAASAVTMPRRSYNVMQGRVDDRGKGRVNNQDTDAWRKKHQVANPSRPVSAAKKQDHAASVETDEKSEIDLPRKDEEEMFDPSDCQQREKMRELAKQRAIQLQREEEERIREQKAKALAKLEELNRRTQAADGSIHKLEKAPPSGAPQQEQPVVSSKQMMHETRDEPPSSALAPNRNVPAHASEKHTGGVVESTLLSRDPNLEKPKNAEKEPVVSHGQSLSLKPDGRSSSAADSAAAGTQAIDTSALRQKRMGYKQKQSNTQIEKNSTEKLIEVSASEAQKARSSVASKELELTPVVPSETGSSSEPSLQDSSHFMPESLSHQKRKNNRNSKSKPKMDDNLPHPGIPSPAPRETNPDKTLSGNGKPKISSDQSQMDPSSVQPVTSVTRDSSIQPSEQNSSLPSEEAQGRGNYQWKPQHSRRVQRNPQANRPAGSGEAVIWAPVRPQNKAETVDESSQKNVPEVVVTTAAAAKTDDLGQNNVKSKRAEMERYVPKPAAKEQLSQQGIVQQPIPSSVSPTGRAESGFQGKSIGESTKLEAKIGDAKQKQPISSSVSPTGRAESGYQGKAVGGSTNLETKNGDAKQKQPGKTHGAWRQRGPVESSRVQGSSVAPNQGKNVQKYMDQQESFKPPVIDPLKKEEQEQFQQPIASGEWNDGWHMPDEPPPSVAAAVTSSGVKDQGAMIGRGKRYPHKGHRNNQDYADQGNNTFDDTEISQQENRGVGEQKSSQWQAKSQSNYQRGGSRSSGIKKDFPNMQQDNEFMYENKYGGGKTANVGGHQDGRRERKGVGSSKGRPHSPNEGFVGPTEEEYSSSSMDARQSGQQQQQFSSGFRKNGSQNNNRSVQGHEPRGEWSSGVQDNKPPPNRERRRQNSHYEYQPVGSSYNNINNNNSKSNNFEGPRDGSRNFGSRNRERAEGQDGRNSYGQHQQQQQQSVTVQADSGNDWQE